MWRTCSLLIVLSCVRTVSGSPSFVIENDTFMKDGKPFQIISGSFHYSRCPAALWKDRLLRLRAMGLNTIQTYVPWNWHEANEGQFDFTGDADIVTFIKTAQECGLQVLVRAGPFMCGEWEFGGLPAWLLNKPAMILRTYNAAYIKYVDLYFAQLLPKLEPLIYSNGGPILMVQVENEYGSYGNVDKSATDKQYLVHLIALANQAFNQKHSMEKVIIYTTDGGNTGYMTRGSLKGAEVFTTGDGGPSDGTGIFNAMKQFNAPGLSAGINSEDYTGWLTHWGESMANHSSSGFANAMVSLLKNKGSINMYMGFGGTNFGFMSGANGGGNGVSYHITSYDYNSPLAEGGQHGYGSDKTDKFEAFRKAILSYTGGTLPAELPPPSVTAFGSNGTLTLTESASMLSAASIQVLAPNGAVMDTYPRHMEVYGQNYGMIAYSAKIPSEAASADAAGDLKVFDYVRDRAQVFVGGVEQATTLFRNDGAPSKLTIADGATAGADLMLLVENMGRINFGHSLYDQKGITNGVTLNDVNITGKDAWTVHNLPLEYEQVQKLTFESIATAAPTSGPKFFKGSFVVGSVADTYLNTRLGGGWQKGYIWVNGHNLGRYWEAKGPQHALYVPSCFLKTGANEVIVLELHPANVTLHTDDSSGSTSASLTSTDAPDFSRTPPPAPPGKKCTKPTVGDVLQIQKCDSSKNKAQLWKLDGGKVQLALAQEWGAGVHGGAGALCVSRGPGKDPGHGFPLAQLELCKDGDAAEANVYRNATHDIYNAKQNSCLDVSNHYVADGSPVGWYECTKAANQQFTLVETPLHGFQLVEKESGKCLTAC
jgi:hypothetical protein